MADEQSQNRPHLIIISYYFPPANAIGGQRPHRFYKYLKRAGYTCDVITACEQLPGSPPDVMYVPDPTAHLWASKEELPQLTFEAQAERVIRRFVLPGHIGIGWSRHASAAVRDIVRRNGRRKTVILSTYPPSGAHLAGLQAAWSGRIPWIADFRDPMALDPTLDLLRTPLLPLALRRMESSTFKRAAAIIANVEPAAEAWRKRYPGCDRKLHVIWNGFDLEDLPQRGETGAGNTLVHAGSLYGGRNANLIVESLARLRAQGRALDHRLLLVGGIGALAGIDEASHERAIQEGWLTMIRSHVAKAEVTRMQSEARGLLLLQPQSHLQVPGKLFEYVWMGKPILAVIPRGSAMEWILNRSGIPHVCIYPDDKPARRDEKMLEYIAMAPEHGAPSDWFKETFDASKQASQLANILESLV